MKWFVVNQDLENAEILFEGTSDECDVKVDSFPEASILSERGYQSRCNRIRNIEEDMMTRGGENQAHELREKNSSLFS